MRQAISERLLTYRGLPVLTLDASSVKTWDQPYPEMISNYDQRMTCVSQSKVAYL